MNDRQVAESKRLVAVDEFVDQRIPTDFTHTPMTPVDSKAAALSTKLKGAITTLGGKAAIQSAGLVRQETSEKDVLVQELEDELKRYNRTAASIAEEKKNPGIMERFRMPHGGSITEIKAKARSFALGIRDLSLNDEFEAHGHPADAAQAIEDLAEALETEQGEGALALQKQTGATGSIPQGLRDGRAAVKGFDAIVHNVYKDDPETLAAWKTASHVRRVGGGGGTNTPPSPPTA